MKLSHLVGIDFCFMPCVHFKPPLMCHYVFNWGGSAVWLPGCVLCPFSMYCLMRKVSVKERRRNILQGILQSRLPVRGNVANVTSRCLPLWLRSYLDKHDGSSGPFEVNLSPVKPALNFGDGLTELCLTFWVKKATAGVQERCACQIYDLICRCFEWVCRLVMYRDHV